MEARVVIRLLRPFLQRRREVRGIIDSRTNVDILAAPTDAFARDDSSRDKCVLR